MSELRYANHLLLARKGEVSRGVAGCMVGPAQLKRVYFKSLVRDGGLWIGKVISL